MRARFIALIVVMVIILTSVLSAQQLTATLVGDVTDTARARIPNADIRVRNVDTNQVRTGKSNASGEYTISELPPGVYEVTIGKTGFKQLRETSLELKVDETARLDARLEVGSVSESVEVTADVPLLNTETSSRGDIVSPTEIEQMPLNGRNFDDLTFFVPGVQTAEQGGKGSPYVINGARADANGVYINGINDENPRDAGAQAQPPLDSLQEFKLETSGYSAEYGRLAGGVVNMSLKTGTNGYHGSIFEFVRNDFFDASNYFGGTSKLRRNQFGGTLGGPVQIPKLYNGHDRTFFLVSWESYRQVQGTNSIGIVPTPLEISGDFSKSVDSKGNPILLKDPTSSNPCTSKTKTGCFPNNKIPSTRINSIAQALAMKYYPSTLTPSLPGNNNYQASADNGNDWDNFLYKVDHRLTDKDNLSIFFLDRWESSTNPFSGSPLGTFGSTTNTGQKLFGVAETRVFSPTLINEFRAGLTRTTNLELAADSGTNGAAQLGITGTTTDPSLLAFSKFNINGFEGLGDNASIPIRFTVNDYDYNDVVTLIRGKHTIKLGGDVLHIQYFQGTNTNFNGTFTFNAGTKNPFTTDNFADFLLGLPSSTSRKIGTVVNHILSTNYGVFFQDDYKIFSSLTLNLGLRYEISVVPNEENGQESNFVPQLGKVILSSASTVPDLSGTVAAAGLTGLVDLASNVGLPQSLINTNYNNLAPRVGFAWRPFNDNRTVVRSGYGIFYTGSRLSALRTDFFGGFPFSTTQSFNSVVGNLNALTLSNPFPVALAKSSVTTAQGYDVNAGSPYLQSWNLTVERDIGKGVAVEAGYVGSKGTHLGEKYDLNQDRVPNTNSSRPFPALGDIEYYLFDFNSNYNAGILTVRKRFHNGMFFRTNYTYSKSIDENSGLNYSGDGGYQGAQSAANLFAERGRSDFDIRHVFSTNFAYMLPFTRNQLVRGWQLAGSGVVYSGQPFTPQISGNRDVGLATRPDRIGNGGLANPTISDWFDLNAFNTTPAGQFGNSGRNILDGPGTVAINLGLSKQFYFGERTRLQIRWESFNVTNHPNFNLPNDSLSQASAGTITGAKDPRIMQLGARLQF